ncbi:chemotaxis protein MotC [Mesorhizobium sp. A623]
MRRLAPHHPSAWHCMIGLALSAIILPGASMAGEELQPYQLVRSLQLVQDRIANGDHAALPMQGKLLEMIDARLRAASPDLFKEPKNFRALLVYGMSGGNPTTLKVATSRIELDGNNRAISEGVIDYLSGHPAAAIEALKPVDPMLLPSDLGAFLALVKGSLLASEHPVEALALLDQARLLSPGTLVEEAALRRSVAIATAQGDAARFALASTQYVERFLRSPYASQFADAFVAGAIALHEGVSQAKLADITAMMDAEREKVIYLRIARRAAIEGLIDLSTFASAKAEQGRNGNSNEDDPRALLYASLSTVTSATVEEVREKLKSIDRSKLSLGDQSLLDAARAVASEMVAAPPPVAAPRRAPVAGPPPPDASQPVPDVAVSEATDLPAVEGAMPEKPIIEASASPASAAPIGAAPIEAAYAEPVSTNETTLAPDHTDTAIAAAQRKLAKIDQMLGASPK